MINRDVQYTALMGILEELVVLYRALFDLLHNEKSYLIKAEIEKLSECSHTKQALLFKIRALDKKREIAASDLAKSLSLEDSEIRLLQIAKKMPKAEAETLRTIHQTLSLQVERVIEFNQENEQYAQSALTAQNGAMSEIKQTVSVKSTYGKKGTMANSQESNAGNFVSREV